MLAGLTAACGTAPVVSPTGNAADLVRAAITAEKANKLDEARSDLTQAIQLDSKNKEAYFNLGFISQIQGKSAEAERDYRTALIIDPDYQAALYNLGTVRSVSAPYEAIALYYHLIQLDPQNASGHLNLGFALKAVGQTATGQSEIDIALRLNPALGNPTSSATPGA